MFRDNNLFFIFICKHPTPGISFLQKYNDNNVLEENH